MSTERKVMVPKDASGVPMHRAMGVPVVIDSVKLGSGSKWVDLVDLSGAEYNERVFIGLILENPDLSLDVELSFGEDIGSEVKNIIAKPVRDIAFDNLTFGPGVKDESTGLRTTRIRAKLSGDRGTFASATITYAGQPTDGQTVNVGGFVFEFSSDQSATPGRHKVDIGASADLSWTNFINKVNEIDQEVTATINTGTNVVTITSNYGGETGNGHPVSDGSTGAVFSGNLAGGSGGVLPRIHIW